MPHSNRFWHFSLLGDESPFEGVPKRQLSDLKSSDPIQEPLTGEILGLLANTWNCRDKPTPHTC